MLLVALPLLAVTGAAVTRRQRVGTGKTRPKLPETGWIPSTSAPAASAEGRSPMASVLPKLAQARRELQDKTWGGGPDVVRRAEGGQEGLAPNESDGYYMHWEMWRQPDTQEEWGTSMGKWFLIVAYQYPGQAAARRQYQADNAYFADDLRDKAKAHLSKARAAYDKRMKELKQPTITKKFGTSIYDL